MFKIEIKIIVLSKIINKTIVTNINEPLISFYLLFSYIKLYKINKIFSNKFNFIKFQ